MLDLDLTEETRPHSAVYDYRLRSRLSVAVLDVREDIKRGQVVSKYVIEGSNGGAWSELVRGTTIGYRRLHRIQPVMVNRLRLTVEDALAEPKGLELFAWQG